MSRHLYIAGVDRIADLERGSLRIEQALTYQIDTCSFSIKGEQPAEGEEVIVEDDKLGRLFAGIIVKVELARTFPDKSIKVWNVDCDDYTALLDRRLVVESYENMSASDIFLDIVAKYCPGFTTNGVRPGAPVIESTGAEFEYKRPSECFKWLCDYVGWHWQPDYYKDLHFFSAEELANPAPMILRPGGKFRFGKHSIDTQGLRNRVYVRGGTMLSDPQVVQWKADGVARIWTLPWPPHEVSFKVGEVPMTVGVENLHDEEDFDYMMSFSEKYIRCSTQTATPVEGITMALTARQDIPVITMVEDYASQAAIAKVQGGDGIYEHVISDDSLTSIAAAEAAGMADLREHGNPRVKGSFETEYVPAPVMVEKKYEETTQADFSTGTLIDVVATSAGDLELKQTMGKALSFDGVDDYVEIPSNSALDFSGDFTIEAKINIAHFNQAGSAILTKRGTSTEAIYALWVLNTGQISYQVNDNGRTTGGSAVTTKTVTAVQQHHITLRRLGSTVQVLIDGELDNSSVTCSGIISPPENLFFAKHSIDTTQFFPGVIDDVRIWNVARTDQQIQDNMNRELFGDEPGLVGYWKLNEGTGTTAYDSTASSNNGTIYGATWVDELVPSYKTSGTREKIVDLSGANPAGGTKIEWSSTTPTGTSVTVETALSTDGGNTYGPWLEAINGGSIPDITAQTDLTNARLKIKETLTTTDTSVTPQLHSMTLSWQTSEVRYWQPGQIVDIRLPDRGVEGEYLIQRVTITPTWSNPSMWTFKVEYGGRLLGIADFLKALVSAQQKKRILEPAKNVQKYIYSEETLTVGDELITATRGLPFVCGDADAVCGLVVVSNG